MMQIDSRETKLILWDIDGTVLNFHAAQENAINSCFAKFELGECSNEMLQVYSKINQKYWEALERGEITKPQVLVGRFQEFFEKYGLDTSKAEAFNAEYQIRLGDTICFYPGVMDLILLVQKSGILQFAVTNGTKIAQQRKLKNSGLDKIFDEVYISEDVGCEKPNPDFFRPVWDRAKELVPDISLSQIMIIGDSLTSDIKLGQNVGIKTCLFGEKVTESKIEGIDYIINDFEKVVIKDHNM